ncbi:potassium channel family protein [Natronospora cellulosivora (SeqCode)]
MYIIIAGGGIVGRTMASKLVKKHDVIVIDTDQRTCERIYSNYGAITINANATQISTLKEAGMEKCDVALGVMRHDSDNLAFSLLAKNFGVDKILVRMREPEYKSAYKLAGASNIGSTTDMIVNKFFMDIEEPEIRKIGSIGDGKAEISIITIPEKAKCAGKSISDIVQNSDFPEDCIIAGIYDQDEDHLIIPGGSKEIHEHNQVFIITSEEKTKIAAKALMK